MEQAGKSSRKLWLVVAGLAVVALLVIVGVVILVGNGTKKEASTANQSTATQQDVKQKISNDLSVLKDNQQQTNKDQTAAQNAVNNKQVKVMQ